MFCNSHMQQQTFFVGVTLNCHLIDLLYQLSLVEPLFMKYSCYTNCKVILQLAFRL